MNEQQHNADNPEPRATPAPPPALNEADVTTLAERIADITRTGLPLAAGLRALAEELPSGELRSTMRHVTDRLEAGESLQAALQQHSRVIPPALGALFEAGLGQGNMAALVERYLEFTRNSRELRRRAWIAMAYPFVLLSVGTGILAFLLGIVAFGFKPIFEGFGTELPSLTVVVISLASILRLHYVLIIVAMGLLSIALTWGLPLLIGKPAARHLLCMIPIIGTMLRSAGLSNFCQMLATLLQAEIELPKALKLAGTASRDAELEAGSLVLAAGIQQGQSLRDAARARQEFPEDLVQVFRWERNEDALTNALEATSSIYEIRATMYAGLIGVFWEPVFVVGLGLSVGLLVIALFMPLIKLLNDLS